MVDPEIKGMTLKSRIEYITLHFGAASVKKVFAKLKEKRGDDLSNKILATKWYPLQLQSDLDDIIRYDLANGDELIYQKLGAHSADMHYKEKYSGFLKDKDPFNVLKKSTFAFDLYFRPGKALCTKTGPKEIKIEVSLFKSTSKNCQTNIGFYKRAVELSGGKDVKVVERTCTGKGDGMCTFIISWA